MVGIRAFGRLLGKRHGRIPFLKVMLRLTLTVGDWLLVLKELGCFVGPLVVSQVYFTFGTEPCTTRAIVQQKVRSPGIQSTSMPVEAITLESKKTYDSI